MYKKVHRASLVVQWLRLPASTAGGRGFDPWSGKFHMPSGVASGIIYYSKKLETIVNLKLLLKIVFLKKTRNNPKVHQQ